MNARLARLVDRLCAGQSEARITALVGWPGLPIGNACTPASAPPRDGHDL